MQDYAHTVATMVEINKMSDKCEQCKYFYKDSKKIRGIDGTESYTPQYKCKKYHKIVKSIEGWVPRTNTYTCPDFKKV
jgi:hypothetical protein